MDYKVWTTDYGLQTTDCGLQVTDYGLHTDYVITDYGLHGYRLRTTDYAGYGLQ